MGDKTGIEWTDATWNPVSGCSKVSQGCKHCYAERVFPRAYGGTIITKGEPPTWTSRHRAFTDVLTHSERLDQPLRWKKPRRIFVNSMSDLFHEDVPDEFIDRVFAVMALAHWHTFQILTKRPERMQAYFRDIEERVEAIGWSERLPLPNVWLGVSVEDQATADERVPQLLQTPAAVRFLSCEPLLGPVDIGPYLFRNRDPRFRVCPKCLFSTNQPASAVCPNDGITLQREDIAIDWVIAGGESGPHARPSHPDWFRSLRDQCQAAGVPFFFKQWGEWGHGSDYTKHDRIMLSDGTLVRDASECAPEQRNHWTKLSPTMMCRVGKKVAGKLLDGRTHMEFPA